MTQAQDIEGGWVGNHFLKKHTHSLSLSLSLSLFLTHSNTRCMCYNNNGTSYYSSLLNTCYMALQRRLLAVFTCCFECKNAIERTFVIFIDLLLPRKNTLVCLRKWFGCLGVVIMVLKLDL
jgi:hypothetical protein